MTRADGLEVPGWLTFDMATRTFSGIPLNADVGAVGIKVTATDTAGASVFDIFDISIANTNDAPTLATAIADQPATEDSVSNFPLPVNTFTDADVGDTLSYTAMRVNGSALPSWLTFNPTTRTFTGTPLNANVGAVSIKVTATDTAGASVFETFDVSVANTNDAPVLSNAIAGQTATTGSLFAFQFAANTFTDGDMGDTLGYSAQSANGSPLPSATCSSNACGGSLGSTRASVGAKLAW